MKTNRPPQHIIDNRMKQHQARLEAALTAKPAVPPAVSRIPMVPVFNCPTIASVIPTAARIISFLKDYSINAVVGQSSIPKHEAVCVPAPHVARLRPILDLHFGRAI